jgi:hypothetical protein
MNNNCEPEGYRALDYVLEPGDVPPTHELHYVWSDGYEYPIEKLYAVCFCGWQSEKVSNCVTAVELFKKHQNSIV